MLFFSPFTFLFVLALLVLLFLIFLLVHIGLITIAAGKIGLTPNQIFLFLLASLIGSHINIPLARIRRQVHPLEEEIVRFFGIPYRVPPLAGASYTVVALNLGGGLLPVLISLYLWFKQGFLVTPIFGIGLVAFVCYRLARPVPGVGIAIPLLIPPLVAAFFALLFAPEKSPAVAYISGTLGTLIGADLLHLKDITKIRAPVVSIGGAGTFDGIFLTGIVAVLLA
ncbi:DUF1614 domain-containing protein [Thermosulfurimonas dismutans]|uniref:DUF1614 domain-containing protein n=1 Tax=Thermosulfurimonas dismutans TaxID=999894 RepID=A0A179D5Y1_9BACT|nr:DUF1614 domain-containing protein [Thermosulfurimonas dismutans]OAQ21505.1 hypothetical protein TDIS_0023 [Thermosulfurimonas dismutans]